MLLRWEHTPNGLLVSVSFVLEICLTSIASSIYEIGSVWFALYLARPATHNQVHELIEPLGTLSALLHPSDNRASYPDGANDADRQLLVEPDLDRRALLQEPEEEVDWGQQNPATATTSASHCVLLMGVCRGKQWGWLSSCLSLLLVAPSVSWNQKSGGAACQLRNGACRGGNHERASAGPCTCPSFFQSSCRPARVGQCARQPDVSVFPCEGRRDLPTSPEILTEPRTPHLPQLRGTPSTPYAA